ncbi:MAG TPA: hypothetical protein ENI45_02090 [Thermoplasmatales archaeon]|nr:hypothetical protein [Thermoplasmatales archaeon]
MCKMYRKGLVAVTVLLFIGVSVNPVVGLSGVEKQKSGVSNGNNGFYNITVYRFKKGLVERVVKKVSYEDALEIKREYSLIDCCQDDSLDKVLRKCDVLIRYGVLSEDDLLGCGNRFLSPRVLSKLRCAEKTFHLRCNGFDLWSM